MTASLAVLLALPAATRAENPPAGCKGNSSDTWLNVVAEGMHSSDGLLAITLYADIKKKFLVRNGSLHVARVQAVAGTTRACIFLPKPGTYAVVLYHDENANRKLDRGALGIPTEGYGFTNNPGTFFGLPSFKSVRLNVPQTADTTKIRMKYR
ncbi:MAG: DUF2141 domain-containing protein [Novosphingobium sp.]|nr:DUF2141 domain-containing protein [Novosphingobium sp.]